MSSSVSTWLGTCNIITFFFLSYIQAQFMSSSTDVHWQGLEVAGGGHKRWNSITFPSKK